ncbi:MAG: hypothetical protein WCT50_00155 [Patescibacteria group bacterium]
MGNIKDLPGAGGGFRATSGAGNFSKKFNSAARVAGSALYNLQDNKKAIIDVIRKSQGAIRIGKFDRLRQLSAYNAVRKIEGNKLTKEDKKDLKLVLKHLGSRKEDNEGNSGSVGIRRSQMQLDRDNSFEKERNEKMKGKIGRFDRATNGGEAKLSFASRPDGADDENLSMSGKLLQRRFNSREKMFKDKLPSNRIGRDMGAVQPPPAITRAGEPNMQTPPSIAMEKDIPHFQNL